MAHLKVIGTGVFGAAVEAVEDEILLGTTILGVTGTLAATLSIGGFPKLTHENPAITALVLEEFFHTSGEPAGTFVLDLTGCSIADVTIDDTILHTFEGVNAATTLALTLANNKLTSMSIGVIVDQWLTYAADLTGSIFCISGTDNAAPVEAQWEKLMQLAGIGLVFTPNTTTVTVASASDHTEVAGQYTWSPTDNWFARDAGTYVLGHGSAAGDGDFWISDGGSNTYDNNTNVFTGTFDDGGTPTDIGVSLDPLS